MEALLWVNENESETLPARERESDGSLYTSNIIQDDPGCNLAFSYWSSCGKFVQTKTNCVIVWPTRCVADDVSTMYRAIFFLL